MALDNAFFHNWYAHGRELLAKYRDPGFPEMGIPTDEWFKARLDPVSYEYWNAYDFRQREEVSDKFYSSLGTKDKDALLTREARRWDIGLWKQPPAYLALSDKVKREFAIKYPCAGWCQVMTGTQYMLLNYLLLDGVIRPIYFRRDAMLFDQMACAQRYPLKDSETREMMATFKCRSSRYSTSQHAMALNNMFVGQNFKQGLAVDLGKKIWVLAQPFEQMYASIPDWFRRESYKDEDGKTQPLFQTRTDGNTKIYTFKFLDTQKNRPHVWENRYIISGHQTTDWEGQRLKRFDIDEAGICQYSLQDLIKKASSCCTDEESRRGGLVTIGGVSNANNHNNNPHLRNLAYQAGTYGTFVFFSGKQHSMYVNKATGWTDEARAIADEQKKRDEIKSDLQEYTLHITDFPIAMSECFVIRNTTRLDVEALRKFRMGELRDQMNNPKNDQHFVIQRGWLEKSASGDVRNPIFRPDEKGGWRIIEQPDAHSFTGKAFGKPDLLYCAGGDNIHKSTSAAEAAEVNEGGNRDRRSKHAMVILNAWTGHPVAYYLYRHANPQDDFMQCLLATQYYNCFYLPETNIVAEEQFFFNYQDDHIAKGAAYSYLRDTPKFLQRVDSKPSPFLKNRTQRKGVVTGNNKIPLYDQWLVPYMTESYRNIRFPELLETHETWNIEDKKFTPDLGMAHMMSLICYNDIKNGRNRAARQHRQTISATDFYSATRSVMSSRGYRSGHHRIGTK